jgi:ubiquinone/menaquinone biosynthesis C-methylase UbiE
MTATSTAQNSKQTPKSRRLPRVAVVEYGLRQLARMALYTQTSTSLRRAVGNEQNKIRAELKPPPAGLVTRNLRALFREDLGNVAMGYYPIPRDNDGSLLKQVGRIRNFYADLPASNRRRQEEIHDEVFTDENREKRPRYYLQNFHYQTDGWMSDESARIYDIQVESLFGGSANLMRRQSLVPLAKFIAGKDQRKLRLLDIACGTGRLIAAACAAFPRLNMLGLDLSEEYLHEARRQVGRRPNVRFLLAKGEALPFADSSLDCVTSTFLFHELPPKIRRTVAREMARVLKPGGIYIHMDSLQIGDIPEFDDLLRGFPRFFHEPYHGSYVEEDLAGLFGQAGLELQEATPIFISKRTVFTKI